MPTLTPVPAPVLAMLPPKDVGWLVPYGFGVWGRMEARYGWESVRRCGFSGGIMLFFMGVDLTLMSDLLV